VLGVVKGAVDEHGGRNVGPSRESLHAVRKLNVYLALDSTTAVSRCAG